MDFDCLPEPGYLTGKKFEALETNLKLEVIECINRPKNLYVMNNNGARNVALDDGRNRAKWVLPWDGNCFVTEEAWLEIRSAVLKKPHLSYFAVPMDRVTDNQVLLEADHQPDPIDEPQLIFRRDSEQVFNEQFAYGRRPKVELIWRLAIPGVWDRWKDRSWDLPRPAPSAEAGQFAVAGWVARMASGNMFADENGEKSARERTKHRRLAIVQSITELDRRFGASDTWQEYAYLNIDAIAAK